MTLQKVKESILKYSLKFENQWTEHALLFSAVLGAVTSILYYYKYLTGLRGTVGNVVIFVSIIVGVLGVFLTLIITLRESPVFSRMKSFFPEIENKLFVWIRNQLWSGITIVMLSVFISVIKTPSNPYIASFGVFVWTTLFWHICLGSFYTIKLVTDLILRNSISPKRTFKT